MVSDVDNKTFLVYIAINELEKMPIHFEKQAQIKAKAQIGT